MQTLSIDIETYGDVNLSKCGVYKYAELPDFEILLFGYSADGSEVTVIDLAQGERLPQEIIEALTNDTVIKWAFNANFERVCLSRYLRDLGVSLDPFHDNHPLSTVCARFLNPESWRCSMVWAATLGLPLSLEELTLTNPHCFHQSDCHFRHRKGYLSIMINVCYRTLCQLTIHSINI